MPSNERLWPDDLKNSQYRRRPVIDLVLGFGRIEPKPGPRRPIRPPKPRHVFENRGEKINGNDHVNRQGPAARGGVLELERADAQQLAARADQGRAAPQWMARRREDRFLQKVLPVARKLLPRDDAGCYRASPPAHSCDHYLFAHWHAT